MTPSSQQRKSLTGGNMKLSAVIKAWGSLCLLLAEGLSVPVENCPKIIGEKRLRIKVCPGEQLDLCCTALTNCAVDEALIYWLIDDSFPEDAPSAHRITESEEKTSEDGTVVQRNLLLKNVTVEDLKSTFRCIVTNSLGLAQMNIKLRTKSRNCKSG